MEKVEGKAASLRRSPAGMFTEQQKDRLSKVEMSIGDAIGHIYFAERHGQIEISQVIKALGITKETWVRWASGKQTPSVKNAASLINIANSLGNGLSVRIIEVGEGIQGFDDVVAEEADEAEDELSYYITPGSEEDTLYPDEAMQAKADVLATRLSEHLGFDVTVNEAVTYAIRKLTKELNGTS